MLNEQNSGFFAENIIDTICESLLLLNEDLIVVLANRSFYRNFLVSKEDTIGKHIFRLGNGQWNIPELRLLLQKIITEKISFEEYEMKHDFETIGEKVLQLNARLLVQGPNKPSLILLAILDITAQHTSQQKLKESEAKYRKFTEEANSIVMGLDARGNITFFNQFSEKIFGYHRSEVFGKSLLETIIPVVDSSGKDNRFLLEDLLNDPGKFYANVTEGVCKDGSRVWFSWSANALYNEKGEIREILIDGNEITELTKTRKQLEEKSTTLDTLLDFIPEGIMITDQNHKVKSASRYLGEILGLPLEKIIETTEEERLRLLNLYNTEGQKITRPGDLPLSKAIITGKSYKNYELYLNQDGNRKMLSINAVPIRDYEGKITGAIGSWRDITELRNKIEENIKGKRVLDSIMEYTPVGIMLADKDCIIMDVNKWQCEFLGISVNDIIGKTEQPEKWKIFDSTTLESPDFRSMPLCRAIREAKVILDQEYILKRNGEELFFLLSAGPIKDSNDDVVGAISVWKDVTMRKKVEKSLKTSEKNLRILNENLENMVIQRTVQVRRLSKALIQAEQRERKRFSYVLHENLQQLLLGAKLLLNQHQMDHQKKQCVKEYQDVTNGLEMIDKAINTTRTLTIELNPPLLRTQGLDAALQWLVRHMEQHYGLKVFLRIQGAIDSIKDENQLMLTQMVRELLNNVVQHSGVLSATTDVTCADGLLKIVVTDKGKGFDDKEIFSEAAKKNHLGLFSIQERLKLFGGDLRVHSEAGIGTTVIISLPSDLC